MRQEISNTKWNLDNSVISFQEIFKKKAEKKTKHFCNICKNSFIASSKFERFCPDCKEHSELYHFSEWLSAS